MAGYFSTVSAKLDLDISGFEKGLADSTKSLDKVAHKLEGKLLGPRAIAHGLATAFGIGFEKIVDKVAGIWSGVTEQARESYKEIAKLSEEEADRNIEQMHDRVSEEHKYQLLLKQRIGLQKNPTPPEKREPGFGEKALGLLASGPLGHMFGASYRAVAEARLAENEAAAVAAKKKDTITDIHLAGEQVAIEKKRASAKEAADKAGKAADLAGISDAEKLAKMKEEQLANQIKLGTLTEGQLDYEELRKTIYEDMGKIKELEAKISEKNLSNAEKATKEYEHQRDLSQNIVDAMEAQGKAQRDMNDAIRDRSGSTLEDLAKSHSAPGRVVARQIMQLEKRAKQRRASGFAEGADQDVGLALSWREGLGGLTTQDRDPLQAARDKLLASSAKFLDEINKKLSATKVSTGGWTPTDAGGS